MSRMGCYCQTFKIPAVRKMTVRWGDMGGWRSLICAQSPGSLYGTKKMNESLMEMMHRVQRDAAEQVERLIPWILLDDPMPVTSDILERTRHWNSLKSMVEKIVLQTVVLTAR